MPRCKELKVFFGRIEEEHSDRGYTHDFMIYAKSKEEAEKVLHQQARHWYPTNGKKGGEKISPLCYSFADGEIWVSVEELEEEKSYFECMKRIVKPMTVFSPRARKQAEKYEPWRLG